MVMKRVKPAKDRLFRTPKKQLDDFEFGESTAGVFDDMLSRSVPFYKEIQRMVVELSGIFMQPGTSVYDLGCSTGTTLSRLAKQPAGKEVRFVGVDNSGPMLQRARAKLAKAGCSDRCELRMADLNEVAIDNASVVIMILTMQFVRPLYRDALIRKLYEGLTNQGCLILIEKVLCDDSRLNRIFISNYYQFKRREGYSELEIGQKREALENVLIPYRVQENFEMLSRNGFQAMDLFFRWYNFCGLIAVKTDESRNGKGR